MVRAPATPWRRTDGRHLVAGRLACLVVRGWSRRCAHQAVPDQQLGFVDRGESLSLVPLERSQPLLQRDRTARQLQAGQLLSQQNQCCGAAGIAGRRGG